MNINKGSSYILALTIVSTFVALRVFLDDYPGAGIYLGDFHLHHIYAGIILMLLFGIPLMLSGRINTSGYFAVAGFGIGAGLTLDELIYLAATSGVNGFYPSAVSFWGGVFLISFFVSYILLLVYLCGRED